MYPTTPYVCTLPATLTLPWQQGNKSFPVTEDHQWLARGVRECVQCIYNVVRCVHVTHCCQVTQHHVINCNILCHLCLTSSQILHIC